VSNPHFAKVQQLGRSLMLPIAVLPIAGLLLRLGQPDLMNVKAIAQGGEAVFDNLPLLFAIGVSVGFARDGGGVAGLAGALGYLVMMAVRGSIDSGVKPDVLGGIFVGLIAGALYNRYKDIDLPPYLAFFGGKRFVPIVTGVACVALGGALGIAWPPVQRAIDGIGTWLIGAGSLGLFVFGVLNRILIVTGLHHILNNLVWFVFGSYASGGKVVTGDIHRFFAGDSHAGAFMTGFFPIMMFGLPAACLAMYRAAPIANRRATGGMLLSMALTSFLTGVTEPIEFTFMFLAPELFAIHAVLTGLSMALMNALGVRLGFTFSAGAFDYVLSYGLSTRGWLLIPIGLGYFAVYYGVFLFAIRRFDLATPGREPVVSSSVGTSEEVPVGKRSPAYLEALGGAANLVSIDACTTRLRLVVRDAAALDDAILKALGAKGVLRLGGGAVQVVIGPEAERIADGIRAAMAGTSPGGEDPREDTAAWVGALGGAENVRQVEVVAKTRIRLEVGDAARVDEAALQRAGAERVVRFSSTLVHVVAGTRADEVAAALGAARMRAG
jgi:N-acetylglucosamine PTS system EIICBA or EIICB component